MQDDNSNVYTRTSLQALVNRFNESFDSNSIIDRSMPPFATPFRKFRPVLFHRLVESPTKPTLRGFQAVEDVVLVDMLDLW